MRHAVICAVLALFAVVLQVMLVDRLPLPGGSTPDIPLLVVVSLGLTQGSATGMLTGFGAGLGLDLAPPASHLIGESALIFCLVGYSCGQLSGWLDRSPLRLVAATLIGTGTGETLQAAVGMMVGDPRVTLPAVRHVLPVAVLYDVLLSPVVLSLVVVASRRSGFRPPGTRSVRAAQLAGMETIIGDELAGGQVRADSGRLNHRRARSRPGGVRNSASSPRTLGPGRGRKVRRPRLRPGTGRSAMRIGPHQVRRARPGRPRVSASLGERAGINAEPRRLPARPGRLSPRALRTGAPPAGMFRRHPTTGRLFPGWIRRRWVAQRGRAAAQRARAAAQRGRSGQTGGLR